MVFHFLHEFLVGVLVWSDAEPFATVIKRPVRFCEGVRDVFVGSDFALHGEFVREKNGLCRFWFSWLSDGYSSHDFLLFYGE